MKKERLEVNSLGTPRKESQQEVFEEKASKEENYEKIRKGPATKVAGTT